MYKFLTVNSKKELPHAYVFYQTFERIPGTGNYNVRDTIWQKIQLMYLENNFHSTLIMVDENDKELFTEVNMNNYEKFRNDPLLNLLNEINDNFGKQHFYSAPDMQSERVKIIKDKNASKKEEKRFSDLLGGAINDNLKDSGINGIILE